MALELRWKSSVSASCLHAALCRQAGIAAADPELEAILDAPAMALAEEIAEAAWPAERLMVQLAGLASEHENNRELVERALAKLQIRAVGPSVVRVAGAIADLEAAVLRTAPALAEELAMRGRPMREQWEARGPGMLLEIARLADVHAVPECAEIVLVAPYSGGHGWAHAAYNRVTLEALLVNPQADLPEAVRLAWLIAQLNSDLPRFAEALPAGRAAPAAAVAMIPAVLAAGEAVELARCDEGSVAQAMAAWRLETLGVAADPHVVWQWWTAWMELPEKWPVAVAALERMLVG